MTPTPHTPPTLWRLAVRNFTAPIGFFLALAGIGLFMGGVDEYSKGWTSQANWESHMLMLGFGSTLAIVGAFLASRGLRTARRKMHIYENGRRAQGTVVAVERSNVTINKKPQWQIRYSYRDLQGHAHEAISEWMPYEQAHEWSEGQQGQVRYDADDPAHAFWVGR